MEVTAPVVRTYADSDRPQVLALDTSVTVESVLRVRQDGESFLLGSERLETPIVKSFDLEAELEDAIWDAAWVAETADGIIGFGATRYDAWNRRQILLHLYVSPESRRRGIGQRLVAEAAWQGRANSADHVWLETSNANVPAVRAYERMGFRLCGLDVTLYDGTPERGEIGLFMSQPVPPG